MFRDLIKLQVQKNLKATQKYKGRMILSYEDKNYKQAKLGYDWYNFCNSILLLFVRRE